jgi:hypothetical protein
VESYLGAHGAPPYVPRPRREKKAPRAVCHMHTQWPNENAFDFKCQSADDPFFIISFSGVPLPFISFIVSRRHRKLWSVCNTLLLFYFYPMFLCFDLPFVSCLRRFPTFKTFKNRIRLYRKEPSVLFDVML